MGKKALVVISNGKSAYLTCELKQSKSEMIFDKVGSNLVEETFCKRNDFIVAYHADYGITSEEFPKWHARETLGINLK